MSFITKDIIHTTLVDSVYNEVTTKRANYYYFIGKILPWSNVLYPDNPVQTYDYEYNTRNEIIAVKKIQPTDISYVVPRIDWISGSVYDQYDGDYYSGFTAYSGATSLKSAQFYVLVDEKNVYKCLFNQNGSSSTVKPTGTSVTPFTTSDGYVWKFLYTIPLSQKNRFLTEDYMPVQKSVTNQFYSNGEVDTITINSRGSGYFGNSETTLLVQATFLSNVGNITPNLTPVFNTSGSIVNVIVRNAGNNIRSANIVVVDNTGLGTSYYKNLSNVEILNPGSGYLSNVVANTTATITTTGTQPSDNALVTLTFNNNSLVNITIINSGSGYTRGIAANTTLTITTTGTAQPTQNASARLNFANSAILTPVLLNDRIDRVLIEDPGLSYRSNIQTTLVLTGDGANAYLIPFINTSGELEDVIIESRGEGYTYLDIEVVGDGANANVTANFSTGDLDSLQGLVELSAIPGALYAFRVRNGGNSYSNATISVSGNGTDFAGYPVISNTNTISHIVVTNPGSGYTFANVTITGNGSNANVQAIFSPVGGHGSDPVKELFADTLIFYSTINNEKIHGLTVNNDYRQFGLVKEIKQYGSGRAFANITGTPAYLVTVDTLLDSTSNIISQDTVLIQQSNPSRQFKVIEVNTANTQILLLPIHNYTVAVDDVLYDNITASQFTVESVDRQPTINKFSGDMLFIDNRTSVSYSDQQLVTIKTVIKL